MPIVTNATEETITIRLCGNWFTFKPGASKTMSEDLARFISTEKKDAGLAVLPDRPDNVEGDASYEELALRTREWEEQRKAAIESALDQYISRLRKVIYNNQVSLRTDLEKGNIKADPASFASDGEIDAMKIVAKYQRKDADAEKARIDEVKKLMEQVSKK